MKQKYLDETFTRAMTFRYAFALGLLAVLSIAAYLVLIEAIKAQDTHAAVVNVAGRQRMLSQRIEVFSLLLVGGEDQAEREEFRQELLDAVSLMEKSHNGLINGDPSMNLPGDPSPRMRAMYFDPPMSLDSEVRKYLSEAKALADAPDAELTQDNPRLQYVITMARDELLKDLDAVVKQYEIEAEEDNARLQRLEALVLGVTLTVLLMVALFIFRPMVRRIQRDITERRRAEEDLKSYATRLEESNRLKDLFTDIMAHDLQNPLSVVKGVSELMARDKLAEESREQVEMIRASAEKMNELITSASMLSKLAGREELAYEERDLNAIFKDVVRDFEPLLKEKMIRLDYRATGERVAHVHGMIGEVFANLLSNAVKYSPSKSRVTIGIHDEGEAWKVMVADTGEGIPGEHKEAVFERFERGGKKGVKGSGLGLAIVKSIVELHNGRVWVEDNTPRGSIFNVKLPKGE